MKDKTFALFVSCLDLAFKEDDLMSQGNLFELQDRLLQLAGQLADTDEKALTLCNKFPYLFRPTRIETLGNKGKKQSKR